jgi:hypothetical protein
LSSKAYLQVVVPASALLLGCGGGSAPDFDRDGVSDARDLCDFSAEDFNGYLDGDGCADGSPTVCEPNQAFGVEWEVDTGGANPVSFTCAQTPPSHVEVFTNANQFLPVSNDPADCDDREPYNWYGTTQGNIPVGTVILGADLISDVDGTTVLSTLDVPLSAQVPISPCAPVYHQFQFPVAP